MAKCRFRFVVEVFGDPARGPDAGLILQLDDPAIAENWDMINPEPTLEEYKKFSMVRSVHRHPARHCRECLDKFR
jgi:hypothetical protein